MPGHCKSATSVCHRSLPSGAAGWGLLRLSPKRPVPEKAPEKARPQVSPVGLLPALSVTCRLMPLYLPNLSDTQTTTFWGRRRPFVAA